MRLSIRVGGVTVLPASSRTLPDPEPGRGLALLLLARIHRKNFGNADALTFAALIRDVVADRMGVTAADAREVRSRAERRSRRTRALGPWPAGMRRRHCCTSRAATRAAMFARMRANSPLTKSGLAEFAVVVTLRGRAWSEAAG